MGKKRTGPENFVLVCTTLLTYVLTASCAPLESSLAEKSLPPDECRQYLAQAQGLLAENNYAAALEQSQKSLSLCAADSPADEALYTMALIYADPGNPQKDCDKSTATFKELIKGYPQSTWTEQAKIWIRVIQESENTRRVAATVTEESDDLKHTTASLRQENEKLKWTIEESKKVDIEIEEKKRR